MFLMREFIKSAVDNRRVSILIWSGNTCSQNNAQMVYLSCVHPKTSPNVYLGNIGVLVKH